MKTIALFLLMISTIHTYAQLNKAFVPGEKLVYKVKYRLFANVYVGEVEMEVKPQLKKVSGRDCYHIVLKAKNYEVYDRFFTLNDRYETIVDAQTLEPYIFIRRIEEGNFRYSEDATFNWQTMQINTKTRKREDPEKSNTLSMNKGTFDILSAIYYARSMKLDFGKKNQSWNIPVFLDDRIYNGGFSFMGKEQIKTPTGRYNAIKISPILELHEKDVLEKENAIVLWVTDDFNKVPVRIEADLKIGKVRVDLAEYTNLGNELTAKK